MSVIVRRQLDVNALMLAWPPCMMNSNICQDHSSHRSHRRTCVCKGVSRELQAVLTLVKMDLCLSLSPFSLNLALGLVRSSHWQLGADG